jgi:hypothetical protein
MARAIKQTEQDNWEDRAGEMICRTCMFYVPKRGVIGRCRRNAPTMQGYPVVYETDWCGNHKIDADKLEG